MNTHDTISSRQLRTFGLLLTAGFSLLGILAVLWSGEKGIRPSFIGIAFVIFVCSLIRPQVLRGVYKVWMVIGEILGWINTRIILGLVFYGLFVPFAVAFRLKKRDAMRRSFDPSMTTYRVSQQQRDIAHMLKQF